jgi:hypothetical protein
MSVTLWDNIPADTPGAPDFSITNTQPATPPAPTIPASTASNKKWLRSWDLVVGQQTPPPGTAAVDVGSSSASRTQGGGALSLADFRIVFDVELVTSHMPWKLTATVYNVPPSLANQIAAQYTNVVLVAGYQFPHPSSPILPQGYKSGGSMIFTGDVVWYERGRDSNSTDTFLRIYANSFDVAHNQAVINTTLPAGYTQKDVVQACVDAMAKDNPGVKLGVLTPGMGDVKSPRGRTLYGMPREILRDTAQSVGGFVYIDAVGRVNILKTGDNLAPADPNTPIIEFNYKTGMIGIPSQNVDGGMSARCLLNPAILPFTQIHLNNDEITRKTLSQTSPVPGGSGLPEEVQQVQFQQAAVHIGGAQDGVYKVWSVKHSGDTRGNPWYTDVITQAANPASQAPKLG